MRYIYFITYTINILILCLIFLDILKLDEFNYFISDKFSEVDKFIVISVLFILYIF